MCARLLPSRGAECADESGLCGPKFSVLDPEVDLILPISNSAARPRFRPFVEVNFAPVLILLRRAAVK